MSTSHRRCEHNVAKVDLDDLSSEFKRTYGRECLKLVARLRSTYPEITKPGRRTGKSLEQICFVTWSCCRHGNLKLIPALAHAAVLLSAQDDYLDNRRISTAEKESFCAAMNRGLRGSALAASSRRSRQVRDLSVLWSYVARTIPRTAPNVRSYWAETACRMNDAMAVENRAIRSATTTYDEYMRSAIDSMGMVFMWATYLAHDGVRMTTLRELEPILARGSMVARLANDLASYRENPKTTNAVTLVEGGRPKERILQLVDEESCAFHQAVEALRLRRGTRDVLLDSVDFLREFYTRSNFGAPPR